ncbi:MAG TPA: hypothetical protein VHK91_07280 [Flavisolibacter sp.]|jgi:hypothetical protein|nr:hypothetical protein [Flavisolibacter sp.]
MARLVSAIKIKGTLDDITFYGGPDGETYVKMKSSLNAEKFWSWPSFENSRRSAQRMGMASRLTSLVYTCMEKGRAERTNTYRRKMVGVVFHWLKSGMTGMEVVLKLAETMEVSIAVLKTRELCLRQHVTDYSAEGFKTAAKETTSVNGRQTAEREEPIAFGLQLAVSKRASDYGLQMAVGHNLTPDFSFDRSPPLPLRTYYGNPFTGRAESPGIYRNRPGWQQGIAGRIEREKAGTLLLPGR